MFDIQYQRFPSLEETLVFIRDHPDCALLAGGTDLMVQLRAGKRKEKTLVDILLPELCGFRETDGAYEIGASTSLTETADAFRGLAEPYRMLADAADSVGSCQTRNLGTIGGNVCTGNASSDMATAFLALDAVFVMCSAEEERVLPADAFFVRNRVTALRPGELLRAIRIPKQHWPVGGAAFVKLGKRRGHVIATLNLAGSVGMDEHGVIRSARLAGGTLAEKPIRFYESEKLLIGSPAGGEKLRDAIGQVQACMQTEMRPRDSRRGSRQYRIAASTAAMADVIFRACGREE